MGDTLPALTQMSAVEDTVFEVGAPGSRRAVAGRSREFGRALSNQRVGAMRDSGTGHDTVLVSKTVSELRRPPGPGEQRRLPLSAGKIAAVTGAPSSSSVASTP